MRQAVTAESAADEAMARYSTGEDDAFREVYDHVAPVLRAYLRRRTNDASLVEDLIQHAFLRIHRQRGRFAAGARVLPWAIAITARLLIDRVRRARYQEVLLADGADDVGNRAGSGVGPDEWAAAQQLAARIEQEIVDLPPLYRDAFVLVRRDGASLKDAAATLGTTVNGVKLRLFRAYARLRASLADDASDGGR